MTKKSMRHASTGVGLIYTASNLRRIFNLVDHNLLKKYFKVLASFLWIVSAYFKSILAFVFCSSVPVNLKSSFSFLPDNRLYLTLECSDY